MSAFKKCMAEIASLNGTEGQILRV